MNLCTDCNCLISHEGIHAKNCSRNISQTEIPETEHIPEDVNLPGNQLDKSSDGSEEESERENIHLRIKIFHCNICNHQCYGKRDLIKHNNACHPNITNDDQNDAIDKDEFEDDDEGVVSDNDDYVQEEKPKSRKKATPRGYSFTEKDMRILKVALNDIGKGDDEIKVIEDVANKTNLKKEEIQVSLEKQSH